MRRAYSHGFFLFVDSISLHGRRLPPNRSSAELASTIDAVLPNVFPGCNFFLRHSPHVTEQHCQCSVLPRHDFLIDEPLDVERLYCYHHFAERWKTLLLHTAVQPEERLDQNLHLSGVVRCLQLFALVHKLSTIGPFCRF